MASFQRHIESLREHMKVQLYWVRISAPDLDQEEQKSVEVGMIGGVGKLKFGFNVVSSAAKPRLARQPGNRDSHNSTIRLNSGGWPMARFHFARYNVFTRTIQLWSDVTILFQCPSGCSSLRADR
jgi:hypothetical protein